MDSASLNELTWQSIVDLARIPLNDGDKTRYPDDVLLAFAGHGLLQVLKHRPDLFIGRFRTLPGPQAVAGDAFPLPPEYAQRVADYVTARAEMADDEHAVSGRAAAFMQLINIEAQP